MLLHKTNNWPVVYACPRCETPLARMNPTLEGTEEGRYFKSQFLESGQTPYRVGRILCAYCAQKERKETREYGSSSTT
jgi:hypothetical protein